MLISPREMAEIILNNGQLTLSLDRASGSGFHSKNHSLYGKIDLQIKLVSGNSAGTITSYFASLNSHGLAVGD
ncbi:hypothetical protein L6164_004521 [Bauhinia variegata]|uniref:Uncharacterized protein n=1 Tax=Bauhinia variegata TaxID=167791 RepID=A0ACB9Q4P5_BAUVA|nr:hypothetical protein L6164_004521 [Bauhinia variegata]